MIEVPFHPAYYVDTEGCGSYEGLSDEQPTHGRASELDQAIIKAELDNMFRADLYQKIELNLISATDELPPLVPIIRRKGVLMCSEGNISAVVGEAKSKKTFLCTALVGSMLDVCKQYRFDIEPHLCNVLWVDTEQSREHIQKVLFRINLMGKIRYNIHNKRILTLTLREESPQNRFEQMRYAIDYHHPKLVVIDGISDLMNNTNCLEESEALVSKLLQISTIYQCHIMCVLHTNPNSDKARGHLGSTLMRKAETVIYVRKVGDCSIVEPQYCRNMPFDRFAFKVDEIADQAYLNEATAGLGLPQECELPSEGGNGEDDCVRILRDELGGCAERKLLNSKLTASLGITSNYARVKVHRAIERGLIKADANDVVTLALMDNQNSLIS
jgi:hypothetical protein